MIESGNRVRITGYPSGMISFHIYSKMADKLRHRFKVVSLQSRFAASCFAATRVDLLLTQSRFATHLRSFCFKLHKPKSRFATLSPPHLNSRNFREYCSVFSTVPVSSGIHNLGPQHRAAVLLVPSRSPSQSRLLLLLGQVEQAANEGQLLIPWVDAEIIRTIHTVK